LFAQELDLLQTLHTANPSDKLWLKPLAAAWLHQAEVKQALGDTSSSRQNLVSAHELLQTLVTQDPSNRAWQRDLYIAQLKAFDLNGKSLSQVEALGKLEKLHDSLSALSKLEPKKLTLKMLVATVIQRRAAIQLHHGSTRDAATALQPALEQLQQIHKTAPTDQVIRNYLLDALLLNADINFSLNDTASARKSCEAAHSILQPLVAGSSDFRVLAPWVRIGICLEQPEKTAFARKQLEAMTYRDSNYLQYLSTHQRRKANS